MNVLKRIAIATGYAKAPRTMFFLRNPKTGLGLLALRRGAKRSRTVRKLSLGLMSAGAAAALLPVLGAKLVRR